MENKINITAEVELPNAPEVFDLITKCALETLKQEKVAFPAQIDVTLIDDAAIQQANAEYRKKDMVTDVLSFPLYEFYNGTPEEALQGEEDPETGRILLGDMLMNYARACEQAVEYGHSPARECGFLTVHSCLHLLGYDHERGEEEQKIMRAHEESVLRALGLTRE